MYQNVENQKGAEHGTKPTIRRGSDRWVANLNDTNYNL